MCVHVCMHLLLILILNFSMILDQKHIWMYELVQSCFVPVIAMWLTILNGQNLYLLIDDNRNKILINVIFGFSRVLWPVVWPFCESQPKHGSYLNKSNFENLVKWLQIVITLLMNRCSVFHIFKMTVKMGQGHYLNFTLFYY